MLPPRRAPSVNKGRPKPACLSAWRSMRRRMCVSRSCARKRWVPSVRALQNSEAAWHSGQQAFALAARSCNPAHMLAHMLQGPGWSFHVGRVQLVQRQKEQAACTAVTVLLISTCLHLFFTTGIATAEHGVTPRTPTCIHSQHHHQIRFFT